jgi:transposase-like protein
MRQTLNPVVAEVLKRLHYPLEVILLCVRWYSAYPLSLRHLEEMMAERGISVDHSTVHRWAIKLLPVLEKAFRRSKRKVGRSWRMDETYIKVKGEWKYLYRAVDKAGDTVDFLLRAHHDKAAARRFFEQAIERNGAPEKVTIDKSGSNVAALEAMNAAREKRIVVRQVKYLNNICRARPPCHQTSNQTDARLQGFSLRPHSSLRHRTHAHDQERTNERRRQGTNARTAFLLLGRISHPTISAFDRSNILIATEPSTLSSKPWADSGVANE